MSKKDFNLWFSVHDTKDAPKEYNPVKLFEIFSECSETLGNISSLRLYCDEVELPIIVLWYYVTENHT